MGVHKLNNFAIAETGSMGHTISYKKTITGRDAKK